MEKITKEMCINQTNDKWKSMFIYIIIIEILGTLRIWLKSDSIWWLVFCVVTFGALTVIAYYAFRKKFHIVIKNNDFYIVEDVFINVHEINAISNRFNRRYTPKYDYEIKFSLNGIHQILILTKKEPKKLDSDYSAVFFSNPGDKFYLLMSKGKEEERIIKAFNSKYYKLVEDDFDYIDGKYYPKKI